MSKNLKNISLVSGVTMVSRVLGLARDSLTAAVFGTSALASAFVTAYTLPNLFRRLLGEGALTAAFVPTLHEELAQRERTGAFRLVSQVASWLLVVTGALVALCMAILVGAMYWAEGRHPTGVAAETWQRWLDAARLAIWLFPYLLFVCLAAAFSAALQTLQRFLEPALSPVWLNCAILALLGGAVHFLPGAGESVYMGWLCGGVLLGGALQMLVPAVSLMRLGWRPRFDLQLSEQVRAIARLMAPTLIGSAIYLVNMSVSRFIGLSLDDASATVLNLATRLMELPIGVFAIAVTTVVFPLISRFAAVGEWSQLATAYRKGMRLILVINVPAAVGLSLLAEPIVRLLFQRGAFTADDTSLMMPVVIVYALGLPFFSFVNLTLRAFYAQKDTVTPVRAAVLSFFVNLGLSLALMRPWGTLGLALAGNLAGLVQGWYLQTQLVKRRPELHFRPLWLDLLKIGAGSLAMGVGVAGLARLLLAASTMGWINHLLRLTVVIAAGVILYGGTLWLLRIEGRDDLLAVLKRGRRRPATPPTAST